jgi:hypothetical protein
MNWWAVATLVGGYVIGFVTDIGKDYFKETLAERRRERKAAEGFSRVRQAMPDLTRDLKAHFEQHDNAREFVVLRETPLKEIYQNGPEKFRCYREHYPNLTDKLAMLVDAGYIRDADPKSSSPIYRMTEVFVEFVRKS